ncbi:hypothetical protein BDF20DRAFT_881242 [Mycotypha africana]|uniref:uncharacterized protein n=1 Tax=Mycotypha africana TaxID=64632 RepID=UPI002300AC93|nr:uncharacterized protein BDF20DRAFT_881242 [Mycotypha africana]KAI8973243.1 hypothetical protein BDF20DRAFT_881242 [Mycotypha africana]
MDSESKSITVEETFTTTTTTTASDNMSSTPFASKALTDDSIPTTTVDESVAEKKKTSGNLDNDDVNNTSTDEGESLEAEINDAVVASDIPHAVDTEKGDSVIVEKEQKNDDTEEEKTAVGEKDASTAAAAVVAEKTETSTSNAESKLESPSLTTTNEMKANDVSPVADINDRDTLDIDRKNPIFETKTSTEKDVKLLGEKADPLADDDVIGMEVSVESRNNDNKPASAVSFAENNEADTNATAISSQSMEDEFDKRKEVNLERSLNAKLDVNANSADTVDEDIVMEDGSIEAARESKEKVEILETITITEQALTRTLSQTDSDTSMEDDEDIGIITPNIASGDNKPESVMETDNNKEYTDASAENEDKDDNNNKRDSKNRKKESNSSSNSNKGNKKSDKKNKKRKANTVPEPVKEEEPIEEEEYEVEAIVTHKIYKGKVVKYEIKWKGYPPEDNTMESATTIHDDVPDLCIDYWNRQPQNVSRPSNIPKPSKSKATTDEPSQQNSRSEENVKSKETSITSTEVSDRKEDGLNAKAVADNKKPISRQQQQQRGKNVTGQKRTQADVNEDEPETDDAMPKKYQKLMEHIPPYMADLNYIFPINWPNDKTNWSLDVKKICVQQSPLDKKKLFCFIEWNNGKRTIHNMKEVHQKIPEKLIQYYEERLQFV